MRERAGFGPPSLRPARTLRRSLGLVPGGTAQAQTEPHAVRTQLSGLTSRLLIVLMTAIVFAAALGAGFQWGASGEQAVVRVYDPSQQGRIGGDGAPVGDLSGFVAELDGDAWIVRVGDSLQTVRFANDAVVEAMLPIWTDAVEPGDYIVVGGSDDNVNSFITTVIVIIAADQAMTGEQVVDAIRADATE